MKVDVTMCEQCGALNYPDFVISDAAWNQITEGEYQGCFCHLCVNDRLVKAGLSNIAIKFKSGAFAQE